MSCGIPSPGSWRQSKRSTFSRDQQDASLVRTPVVVDLVVRIAETRRNDAPPSRWMSVLTHGARWVVSREGRIVEAVRSSQT
jgi:hypothetical protein